MFYAVRQIYIAKNCQILKNNPATWSHCFQPTDLSQDAIDGELRKLSVEMTSLPPAIRLFVFQPNKLFVFSRWGSGYLPRYTLFPK